MTKQDLKLLEIHLVTWTFKESLMSLTLSMNISLHKPLIRHIQGSNIIINNVWMFTVMICDNYFFKYYL